MRRLACLLAFALSPGLTSAQPFDSARWIEATEPFWSFGDAPRDARQRLVEALPELRPCDETFLAEEHEGAGTDGWGGLQLVQAPGGVRQSNSAAP